MNIGKKIKELRNAKLMTQAELAGDEITRNMLSRIENEAALPSLGTVMYLAQRLGVPAGFLLADGNDEFSYRKMNQMKNIKRGYTDENFELCRDICNDALGGSDDEIELILAECCFNIGRDLILEGHLYRARSILDEAVRHTRCTVYKTNEICFQVSVLFGFLRNLSPMLSSEELDEDLIDKTSMLALCSDDFCRYICLLELIEKNNGELNFNFLKERKPSRYSELYKSHIRAKIKMLNSEYKTALEMLYASVKNDDVPPKLLVYLMSNDIEVACKEIGDYKSAYEYAGARVALLESMLREA